MKTIKTVSIVCFSLSFLSLVVGAAFHSYRMNPEDSGKYSLGVTMGITMISLFAFFLAAGIVTIIVYKKKK